MGYGSQWYAKESLPLDGMDANDRGGAQSPCLCSLFALPSLLLGFKSKHVPQGPNTQIQAISPEELQFQICTCIYRNMSVNASIDVHIDMNINMNIHINIRTFLHNYTHRHMNTYIYINRSYIPI